MAQVSEELCKGADEEERQREESARQESGIKAKKVEKRGGKRVEKKRYKYISE